MNAETDKPYSVLLLYPDTIAADYGQETYYAHVTAPNAQEALRLGRVMAARANIFDDEKEEAVNRMAESFICLSVIAGHHDILLGVWDDENSNPEED